MAEKTKKSQAEKAVAETKKALELIKTLDHPNFYADYEEFFKKQILEKNDFKNIKIAYGGKERQDSIYNGLKCVDKNCKIVLIHDGARPFVDNRIIDSGCLCHDSGNRNVQKICAISSSDSTPL